MRFTPNSHFHPINAAPDRRAAGRIRRGRRHNIDMQTSESSISMGLGGLPPGSYAPRTKQATGKTNRQGTDTGNYYVDDDNGDAYDDDDFVPSLQEENGSLRQEMIQLKMQIADALGKIDELTQINRELRSHEATVSTTTTGSTTSCSVFTTATARDAPSRASSSTGSRRSQGSMALPVAVTDQGQTTASSASSVSTHVSRQSFRVGASMSVQSMLTSLRGEADIACIESQQRRSSSSYSSRHTGSQSSLSTSGLSSIDDISVSNNDSSQSLCDDLHDDTHHDIPTPPSSTHRLHSGAQTNSLLRRLSTTLPSLLRGESGDSLATDRINPSQNVVPDTFQERKKIANSISPATLSQFNASTLEFMASAPSTLAQVRKEQDKDDNGLYREMLSDETYIIPLRTDEEQSECPRIVR